MAGLRMKTRKTFLFLLTIAACAYILSPAFAAQHKKEEVTAMITETQGKLAEYKGGGSANLIQYEIEKIEKYIASAQKLLADGKVDLAFNDISIGNLYFPMIEARIDLNAATIELDKTKSKITE
jgi:uncharacterized protein YpmS